MSESRGDDELGSAWNEFCDSLKSLGASVLASPHAHDEVSTAEGMRHLARMVAMSLTQQIDFTDSTDPRFFRSNDDVWQWGGPNVDNVYLGCPLDPSGTYRLTGNISGQPGAIMQVLGKPAAGDPIAVRADRNLVELADASGRVSIVLSGDPARDADVRLPADAQRMIIREYVPSRESRRAGFEIERLDVEPSALDLTSRRLVTSFASSRAWLAQNIAFWQDYTSTRRDEVGINRIEPPSRGPGMGSESIAYCTGFYDLADHVCLVVTVDEPRARYWSIQLYSMGWYEALDVTKRQTSLNQAQSHVDSDGKVRFVIGARDPGVPNWLDCGGHRQGMIHFRAVWCDELLGATAEVVKSTELSRALPADHPVTTGEERSAALRERRLLMQSRFAR